MLKLNEFSHNHHPSEVKLLGKNIRRAFPVLLMSNFSIAQIQQTKQIQNDGLPTLAWKDMTVASLSEKLQSLVNKNVFIPE